MTPLHFVSTLALCAASFAVWITPRLVPAEGRPRVAQLTLGALLLGVCIASIDVIAGVWGRQAGLCLAGFGALLACGSEVEDRRVVGLSALTLGAGLTGLAGGAAPPAQTGLAVGIGFLSVLAALMLGLGAGFTLRLLRQRGDRRWLAGTVAGLLVCAAVVPFADGELWWQQKGALAGAQQFVSLCPVVALAVGLFDSARRKGRPQAGEASSTVDDLALPVCLCLALSGALLGLWREYWALEMGVGSAPLLLGLAAMGGAVRLFGASSHALTAFAATVCVALATYARWTWSG